MVRSYGARINLARRAGRVSRYHTQMLVKQEDVAQHTFNLLNILMILTDGKVSYRLFTAALLHDQGEYITGDIPSPTKKRLEASSRADILQMEEDSVLDIHPNFREEMTAEEAWLMKLADVLDGLIKCCEELQLGNWSIKKCGENYSAYAKDLVAERNHDHVWNVVYEVLAEWQRLARGDKV